MKANPIVLLTDFGLSDVYVGVMKGVIASRSPKAQVIDLTHGIPPQDVRAAAFALKVSSAHFPMGALFVCVVDPGVGSTRRVLWARSARHQFLAPDNGLLSWLQGEEALEEVRHVANPALFSKNPSATFHGRDIFAPVAARLAGSLPPVMLGPRIEDWRSLPLPLPKKEGGGMKGEVLLIDRFGNAITNISAEQARGKSVSFGRMELGPALDHYAEAAEGTALALVGSFGYVELSVRNGDFAARAKAQKGDPVHVR